MNKYKKMYLKCLFLALIRFNFKDVKYFIGCIKMQKKVFSQKRILF
jgi:hypothetical protein